MRRWHTLRSLVASSLLAASCGGGGGGSAPSIGPSWTGCPIRLEAPVTLDGDQAHKTKILGVTWKDAADVFHTNLVAVYGNGVGAPAWDSRGDALAARDIFVRVSDDEGATWSPPLDVSNTAMLSSAVADHDGDALTAPRPFPGDSGKPTVFASGKNVSIIWEDAYVGPAPTALPPGVTYLTGPAAAQGSVVYRESGLIEVPYRAIYIARSADAGATWTVQRMTDGSRDPMQSACRGTGAGWVWTWQEDPEGLQPGEGDGPGDGDSGAKVSKGTDIWYVAQSAAGFGSLAELPAAVRVTDNLGGNTGASRCNLDMAGSTAVIAYEETKGAEGEGIGKYIRYHVFTSYLDPLGTDASAGAGWILSHVGENGRRVRILTPPAGQAGPLTGVKVCFLWKEGLYDGGGPSDIMSRVGYADGSHAGPSDGFHPDQLDPPVDALAWDPAFAAFNAPARNMSSRMGLDADSEADHLEDARAHRGIIRGDTIFLGYTWTSDGVLARYTDLANYNFFVRTSMDGGLTWTDPFDVSGITDTRISVREPRIVGTPNSTDPSAPQVLDTAWLAWGTEVNQYEHLATGTIDLDVYLTRTTDLGFTFSPIVLLAEGASSQGESQLRTTPGGEALFAVWNELVEATGRVFAVFRRTR
ncbi:MAG: choice-of-anchor O protein [Planctomycetota bacterium]